MNILSKYVNSNCKNWDLQLSFTFHAYKTAVHSTTKFSPHYFLYGREPLTPLDVTLFPAPPSAKLISNYLKNLTKTFKNAKKIAYYNIEVAQLK